MWQDGHLGTVTDRMGLACRLAVHPHSARLENLGERVSVLRARDGEDLAHGGRVDHVSVGAGRFASRREEAQDGYASTSARPLEMTVSPFWVTASKPYTPSSIR